MSSDLVPSMRQSFPEAFNAHTQISKEANQTRLGSFCSRRSKEKADYDAEHQNRDCRDNQTGCESDKHTLKADD
jgi:hypothetical protein